MRIGPMIYFTNEIVEKGKSLVFTTSLKVERSEQQVIFRGCRAFLKQFFMYVCTIAEWGCKRTFAL
jgi:hypothetical protein